ncbi:hypothetical protein ANTQUA_LOCUS9489 [Anthophora quadrimaculata]
MIEIILLFVGVVGTLAAPSMPEAAGTFGTSYSTRNITKDVQVVYSSLPGSENLNEKTMPLSKLVIPPQPLSPGEENLVEKLPAPDNLPGTKNLAEKRIPEQVLLKLSQSQEVDQRNI